MNTIIFNRQELKYYINYAEYQNLAKIISNLFTIDKNSRENNKYHVRSLYFDDKSNSSYFEKIYGIEKRKKYRIRLYNLEKEPIKIEIKNRFNNSIFKESIIIEPGDAKKIISGDYKCLLKYNNPVTEKLYVEFCGNYYKPVVIIDYYREAYHFDLNNLRVTFDSDLKKCETTLNDIFSDKLDLSPVLNKRKIILEIKFNSKLPAWLKNVLQLPAFERCAISKYSLSRYME